jgi:hypothetical protein
MKKIINFIIYQCCKRKDQSQFDKENFEFFSKHKKFRVNPKFKNTLRYDSEYLPEESRKFFKDLKENLPHIHKLIDLDDLYSKKLYYKGYEIKVHHYSKLILFKDIKSIDDYTDRYSVYCKHHIDNYLLYVQFLSDAVHNHLSPDGSRGTNIGISLSEIKWIETDLERKCKLRDKILDELCQ